MKKRTDQMALAVMHLLLYDKNIQLSGGRLPASALGSLHDAIRAARAAVAGEEEYEGVGGRTFYALCANITALERAIAHPASPGRWTCDSCGGGHLSAEMMCDLNAGTASTGTFDQAICEDCELDRGDGLCDPVWVAGTTTNEVK